jgi:hypothetical protein
MTDSQLGLPDVSDLKKITYGDLRTCLIANYEEKGNRTLKVSEDGRKTINGLAQLDEFFGYTEELVDGEWQVKNSGVPVTRLHTEAGREFARRRKAEGAGSAMVNRSLALLRRMLHIAYGKENSSRAEDSIAERATSTQRLSRAGKVQRVGSAAAQLFASTRVVLYWCGVRLGEALSRFRLNGHRLTSRPDWYGWKMSKPKMVSRATCRCLQC